MAKFNKQNCGELNCRYISVELEVSDKTVAFTAKPIIEHPGIAMSRQIYQ